MKKARRSGFLSAAPAPVPAKPILCGAITLVPKPKGFEVLRELPMCSEIIGLIPWTALARLIEAAKAFEEPGK